MTKWGKNKNMQPACGQPNRNKTYSNKKQPPNYMLLTWNMQNAMRLNMFLNFKALLTLTYDVTAQYKKELNIQLEMT